MKARTVLAASTLTLGLIGVGASAQAAPTLEHFDPVTVGCPDGEGGFETVQVVPVGGIGHILDENGELTGEKLFIVSIDAAAFDESGTLLGEFHKEYGNRTGHGERLSCSGSFTEEDGVTVFFDILATRR